MSINGIIMNTLKPLNIPVSFQTYKGTDTTYATFFEYLAQGESWSEDAEEITGHYIQLDIWSKGDYTTLVDLAKTLMLAAGFSRTNEIDLYEADLGVYHKGIRFFYAQNN